MEIKNYWNRKYPNVYVTFFHREEGTKYLGKILSVSEEVYLSADTIGELINQGEAFLRKQSSGK